MSILQTITNPADRPIIATICGDAGTGKTSLAATFPKPIFIRAEDGLASVSGQDVAAFPLINKAEDCWDQLKALLFEEHPYRTLVIDSVSSLERIFIGDIMSIPDNSGKLPKSLNTAMGGYGAGKSAVASMHQRVRKAAGMLNERKGMNIVFISHADIQTMRLPDVDDYQRYSLRLMPDSMAPYVDDVDMVGFIRLQSYLRGEDGERKKAISTGDRELIVYSTASSVSKNRFKNANITDPIEIVLGKNPIEQYWPAINMQPAKVKPVTKPTETKPVETEKKETA